MAKDPWTDPDPQPGDFDEYVRTMDPRDIQFHEGNPNAKVTIVVNVEGEDATRLQRIGGTGPLLPEWFRRFFRRAHTHR